jgi:hypothetical protein
MTGSYFAYFTYICIPHFADECRYGEESSISKQLDMEGNVFDIKDVLRALQICRVPLLS